jgi:hypothetical protein
MGAGNTKKKKSEPIELTPTDALALDELVALEARVATDQEAQRAAALVAADVQAVLVHAIALGDLVTLGAIRSQLNVASFDAVMALARRRARRR